MRNTEFSERRLEAAGSGSANFEELPYEDKKYLEMMDENTKKVGKHYQVLLPLKDLKKFQNNIPGKEKTSVLEGKIHQEPKILDEL